MSSTSQERKSLPLNAQALIRKVGSACLLGCGLMVAPPFNVMAADQVSPAEARAIAKEAYIYGFPMVDGYRIQYAYFVDRNNPEFKRRGTKSTTYPASSHPMTK